MAQDALATALAGYVHERWDIPAPSLAADGQELIPVPPVTAAKLALYTAMRTQDVTNVDLARRLGVSESAVRKVLNPDHRSHIGQVERALRAVGPYPRRRGSGRLRPLRPWERPWDVTP